MSLSTAHDASAHRPLLGENLDEMKRTVKYFINFVVALIGKKHS
jgi:hypothetical protein